MLEQQILSLQRPSSTNRNSILINFERCNPLKWIFSMECALLSQSVWDSLKVRNATLYSSLDALKAPSLLYY